MRLLLTTGRSKKQYQWLQGFQISMFRRKDLEQSSFSVYVEKKTKILKSRVDYALHGEHVHYYKKKETLDRALDPKCQVCGLLLSEYRTQKKFESLNKAIREKI